MMLKAVFFDMGGTLDTFQFDREHRLANVYRIRECLSQAGIPVNITDEKLSDLISHGVSAYLRWNMVTNIELKPEEIWTKYFLKGIKVSQEALAPIAEELAFQYETQLYIRKMRAEVPKVLEKIRGMGFIIGCISNTQSTRQVPFSMKEYGIINYFNPIVLSSIYGRRKPDPSIFYYAARLAGVPTSSCAYVGDKINRDILGARRSGFRLAVQIKHEYDNGEKDEGATPDAVIQSLEELIPILEQELEKDKFICARKDHKIKALFFDAGDILYHRPQRDLNLNKFLSGKQLNLHPDFNKERIRLKDLAFSGKLQRHAYYEEVLRLYGLETPNDIKEGIAAMSLDDNTVEIFDGVPATINALKEKGFILGIITDTAMTFTKKLNWFDQYGFGRVWDTVISSKEIGVRKPSPNMYEKAIKQTGVCASEAVFIGHKKTELDGARAIGLKTIAFNSEKDAVADIYIQDFCDLLKVPLLEI